MSASSSVAVFTDPPVRDAATLVIVRVTALLVSGAVAASYVRSLRAEGVSQVARASSRRRALGLPSRTSPSPSVGGAGRSENPPRSEQR